MLSLKNTRTKQHIFKYRYRNTKSFTQSATLYRHQRSSYSKLDHAASRSRITYIPHIHINLIYVRVCTANTTRYLSLNKLSVFVSHLPRDVDENLPHRKCTEIYHTFR